LPGLYIFGTVIIPVIVVLSML